MSIVEEPSKTPDRLMVSALHSFGNRGYQATTLDEVAAAAGVRKQTLLYYHPSKEALLGAVIAAGVADIAAVVRDALDASRSPVSNVVDAVFRLGATRPELLDLIRETLRLGPPASTMLEDHVNPLVEELAGVAPRELVLGAVAIVVGMATEVDVGRALGVEPTLGQLRRRRRILLNYLHTALAEVAPNP